MKTALFLIVPVLVLVLAPLTVVIPGAYSIGPYEAGYNTAKFDYLHNKSYSYSCSPNNGDTYCAAYKVGYDGGWDVARAGWFG
jgi:hypothetical protein